MKIIAVTAIFGFVLLVLEVLAVKLLPSPESSRKLAHMIAGAGAAILPFFLSYIEIMVVAAIASVVAAISMRGKFFSAVHGVARTTYGELYFPLGILACSFIFHDNLLYMFALLAVGLSDALASLIGQAYGHKKFNITGAEKSYVGSATFFVSTVVVCVLLLLAFTPAPLVAVAITSILVSAILTGIEAISIKGIDNLLVPLAAGGLLWLVRAVGFLG